MFDLGAAMVCEGGANFARPPTRSEKTGGG
jgi:hypothetical protein